MRIRLWQAGDMPGEGNKIIHFKEMKKLVKALKGLEVFGYTHKPVIQTKGVSKRLIQSNAKKIKYCNDNNVVINLSANNLKHADELIDLNIGPVVSILPNEQKNIKTPKGRRVVICPATISKITCSNCGGNKGALCGRINRDYIIGFPAHGVRKNKAKEISQEGLGFLWN